MDAEVLECARSLSEPATPPMGSTALSLDLAAPWASSSMPVLLPASTPPPVCFGGGGIDVDGIAATEAFFFGGMSMKKMKI